MTEEINRKLYIVATPIGNLLDLSARAATILNSVDKILAEDTRHSKKLLSHLAINKPIISLHNYNEQAKSDYILQQLPAGGTIALISDAGTPVISDPGYTIVKRAHELGIQVIPIPGACALISGLCASGIPTNKFCFEGFIPSKNSAREKLFASLQEESRTLVFYEAPHRIEASIKDSITYFGPIRMATLARELTKKFETVRTSTLQELYDFVIENNQQRGEIVFIIEGLNRNTDKQNKENLSSKDLDLIALLATEISISKASNIASKITGKKKKLFYDYLLSLNSK